MVNRGTAEAGGTEVVIIQRIFLTSLSKVIIVYYNPVCRLVIRTWSSD